MQVPIKINVKLIKFYTPGPAAAEGPVRTVGVTGGPGNVVGMNKIELLLVPVAMAT